MSQERIILEAAFLRGLLGPRPLFRDTKLLYAELASPDESRIRHGIQRVVAHARMPHALDVDFHWDATFEAHIGGLAELGRSRIRLPMSFVGHSERCATALAHEVAHHVIALHWRAVTSRILARHPQPSAAMAQMEWLTDLTVFQLGLGALLMSGVYAEEMDGTVSRGGYLSDDELRYALLDYAEHERLSGADLEQQLSPSSRRLMLGH
ncbi:hypothetical protein JY651_15930 [Pyxidicoccus parkwayensis]|uniref:Peptidase M48 domain-containing protein n=1 Tax=Pyxidicoccus parkwayensis TaxID=2813578 RepID=A0ABX7P7D8_9BACT|nr:hypothetical protein [Pyxidicoccus parkwaysis]QSQ26325.1 hypothetical protein JY651_15930 [Pyxidicoccus parkwaysis]